VSHPISRFPIPALAKLPDNMRVRIEQVQAKAGLFRMCSSPWRIARTNSVRFSPITTR
jgi:hypothetical protein